MKAMTLGLSHSLGRYKLKFSPDKVDTMIVQAICTSPVPIASPFACCNAVVHWGWFLCLFHVPISASALLDDLDKELNIYAMRVREWYGWHFPELT